MTENERIRQIREVLKIPAKELGKTLGIQSSAVSKIEHGRTAVTQRTRSQVCQAYGVNEHWLRTGEGEMFAPQKDDPIDKLVADHGLVPEIAEMIRYIISLPDPQRIAAQQYVVDIVEAMHRVHAARAPEAPMPMTDEELHAELSRQLGIEKRPGEESEASSRAG